MESTATSTATPQRRSRRKFAAWFAGALVVLASGAFATVVYAQGPPEGTLRYAWSIGDRYGLDGDGDGILDNPDGIKDLAKDKAWIQDPTYTLTFDTCASPAVTERTSPSPTFTLTLSGPEAKTVDGSNCKITTTVKKLGAYTAKVDVKVLGVSVDSRTETVTPRDQLVVSVGDSVASGEGNPDTLEGSTVWIPKWQNEQCHRTSLAGPAQAALRLERRDPHSAVTFVHVACSGASVTKGLLGDYEGQAPSKGKMLAPQLDQVRDLVGNRPIDALTVSIGANDAEFSEVVKACLIQANCHEDKPGIKNGKALFDEKAPNIEANYKLLDARLDKLAKQQAGDAKLRGKVYVTQYMDVTKDDRGQYCTGLTQKEIDAGKLPGETTNTDGINQAEMTWADSYVQDGLNTRVKSGIDAANANGGAQLVWVDGIKAEFATHGYCAQDRYIRTLFESGLYQRGPDGAFHPNAEGHLYGYAKHIEPKLATDLGIAGDPLPLKLDEAGQLADGIHSWIARLDEAGGLDALTNALPLGARDQVQTFLRDKFFGKFLPFLETTFSEGYSSVTELSEKLDDLDGDGKPGVDAFGLANIDLDISGDIQPKLPAKAYDVTLTIKGKIAVDPDLALRAGEIGIGDGKTPSKTDGTAEFSQTVKLHFELGKPLGDPLRLTIPKEGLNGQIKLALGADFGGTDGAANGVDKPALTFNAGGLGLKAVGPANANVVLGYGISDPSGDGFIDATEIGRPLDWVRARCVSGAVNVDLKASASLIGFSSKLGSVKMVDGNLCDGFDPPTVDLSQFGEFQGVTMVEFVNGLAQLSAGLKSIQQSADIDIPFVKEGLSDVIAANDKLVKFFTDNGLTDPNNPMANIVFDPTKRPDLDTIDEILPKLATALGVPMDQLNPRVVDGRLLLDLGFTYDPAPIADAGTLDFGDQLKRTGLGEVSGTVKATIDPKLSMKLGLGIDLRKETPFGQRFFLQLGTGPELSVDAKVTADAALKGKLSVLEVDLADDNATGPITLLEPKTVGTPLLSVDLNGKGDDRLTLDELSAPTAPNQSPIKVTLNAKVPTFGLNAVAKVGGVPFANGKVSIAWPDLTVLNGLSVTVDGNFTNLMLPFAFDPENPRATVTQLLTAAHSGVSSLRSVLATDPDLVKALPLAGKTAAQLDPMLAKLEDKLATLIEVSENLTLDQAEKLVEDAIGDALEIDAAKRPTILALSLTPQTSTTKAALVANIDLGLCSPDRGTLPGCTKTAGVGPFPLNFSTGNSADSMAAASSTGQVKISYDARLRLGIGVELPRVALSTDPQEFPGGGGLKAEPFVLNISSFELGVGASANARFAASLGPVDVEIGSAARPAKISLAARYSLKSPTADPAAPQRMYVSSSLSSWLSTIDPDPTTNGGIKDTTATKATCTPLPPATATPDACATLPVFLNGADLGDLKFTAPDLLKPAEWSFDTAQVTSRIQTPSVQYALIVGGLKSLTTRLEATLRNMPAGSTIPLLGTDPTAGADVLADFRTGVLDPMQDLTNQLSTIGTVGPIRAKVQDALFATVGPNSSVKLLRDGPDTGTDITKADIQVIAKCGTAMADCADTASASDVQDIQFRVPLGKGASTTTEPFDSGFPGLRLSSSEGFSFGIGFELDLAFGVDRTNGFYIPVNAFSTTAPELRVAAQASLPAQIDANIAFIPATITDLTPGTPDVTAGLGVDMVDPGNDGKITAGNLGSISIAPKVNACGNVKLGLSTGGDAKLPAFKADLTMAGGYQCQAGNPTGVGASTSFDISFDNVRVNAGTLVNNLIAPAAKTVRKYTGPLEPVVDALDKPIPGLSDAAQAAGKPPVTWMQLLEAVNSLRGPNDDQLGVVRKVKYLVNLSRQLDSFNSGGTGDIPLGSFDLNVGKAAQASSAGTIDGLMTGITEAGGNHNILGDLTGQGVPADLVSKIQPTQPYNALTFPAFQRPQMLFNLLLGQDVPLVRFEIGGTFLHVPVGPFAFPVGPATVYFGGAFDLSGHFAAGFDTYGIRQAYSMLTDEDQSNDGFAQVAAGVLGGFYIDDYDANGKDLPELLAQAEVVVGAGVGTPGFGVFAEGGVHASAAFDLKSGKDGKVRPKQVIDQLRRNPNPVCLFDASGKIDAFVRLVLSTPLKDFTYPIADKTVYENKDLTAFCAKNQDGVVEPLSGKLYSDGTLQVFSTPESESIRATEIAPGKVEVSSMGVVETFEGVKRVFVDGNAGEDTITLASSITDGTVTSSYVCGGPSRDHLEIKLGNATAYGDTGPVLAVNNNGTPLNLGCTASTAATSGNDTVQGGGGNDFLVGGAGNDAVVGGDGADYVLGGLGDDSLQPGAGNDSVDGNEGDDSVNYYDRYGVNISLDMAAKKAGAIGTAEADTIAGIETAIAGPGEDVLKAAATDTVLDGGFGNDQLLGGAGNDLLTGGSGDDQLVGGGGNDLLAGADGNDSMVGGAGGDIYQGGAGTDTADWSTEPGPVVVSLNGQRDDGKDGQAPKDDVAQAEVVIGTDKGDLLSAGSVPAELHGGPGADTLDGPGTLYGEAGTDLLRGSNGPDELYGGSEADELRGGGGNDLLDGGTADDLLDGGLAADDFNGGDGFDTVDYSSRTATVTVRLEDGDQDGEGDIYNSVGPDCDGDRCDWVKNDNEKVVGGSGNDILAGDAGNQLLIGNAGNDAFNGRGGADRFEGGEGDDDARDDDYAVSKPDPAGTGDTFIMGDGNDYFGGTGGDEHLEGGEGNDRGGISGTGQVFLDMGPGNDTFTTDKGDHTVIGGTGDDRLDTTDGKKAMTMGDGDDVIIMRGTAAAVATTMGFGDDEFDGSNTSPNDDVVDGGPGIDFLIGSMGDDTITDIAGSNTIYAGTGNDTLTTGPGTDEVRGDEGNDVITDSGNDGKPRPGVGPTQYLWGQGGDDTLTLTGTSAVEDQVDGGDGNDTVTTGDGPQFAAGGAGTDTVKAGAGDDRVYGNDGNDTLEAGTGDDYVNAGEGTTNTLDGGPGADRIEGGSGEDVVSYLGRNASVQVSIGGSGSDDDGNAVDESDAIVGHRDDLDYKVDHVIGTNFDDTLRVIDGQNTEITRFEGRGGRDTLVAVDDRSLFEGGDGDDTLIGGSQVDTLDGGNGNDLLAGGAGADVERGGAGNDRFDQGSAVDGGDTITGGADTDVVDWSARPTSAAIGFTPGVGGANDGAAGELDNVDATTESHRAPGTAGTVPTVTLTSAKPSLFVGETTDLTVTVAGTAGTPTGAVELTEGSTRLTTVALGANGQVVVPTRLVSSGTRSLGARYLGDSRYRAATATPVSVTVTKVATKTVFEPLNSPTKLGIQTKLRVVVTPTTGTLQPSGTVTVFEGATNIQSFGIANGKADINLATALALGRHDLTVKWNGDFDSAPSTSAVVPVLVTNDGTSPAPAVAIATTPATPTADAAFSLKATLTPVPGASVSAGTVTFTAEGTSPVRALASLGTADVAGSTATLALPGSLPGGTYAVKASYAPSEPTGAPATGTSTVTVARPATTTALASNLNPAQTDDGITFTATVARTSGSGVPTGRVTFLDGATELGSAPVATTGKASLTRALLLGTHQVTARYEGSDVLAPSTSAAIAQVVKTPTGTNGVATTTALARNGANLVATVTPASGTATGQVRFTVDGTPGATVDLVGTTATTPVPALAPGAHTVTAAYLGSTTHAGSTSAPLAVDVPKVTTSTAIVKTGNDLVATVTPASGTATGSVTFTLDGTAGTPVALVGGKATFTLPTLADGAHTASAAYAGSATHAGSTSPVLNFSTGSVKPSVPGTPTVTSVTKNTATIAWTAPTAPGTSPVSSYTVTVYNGPFGTVTKTVPTGTNALSATITGLVPGQLWRFSVAASNTAGTSAPSALSAHSLPPFRTVEAFIDLQYRDFLGKAATATELATWKGRITGGSYKPEQLMDSAAGSAYSLKLASVVRTYASMFKKYPVQSTVDSWTTKLRAGTTVQAMAQNFATSSTFTTQYGTLSNTNFAKLVYSNVIGRTPTSSELSAMVTKLNSGTPRGTLWTTYSEASDYQAKTKGITTLAVAFRGSLLRLPTSTERTTWEGKLQAGTTTRAQLLAWILATSAYDARV